MGTPAPSEEDTMGAPLSGDDAAQEPSRRPLSERELEILAFERHWWRHAGAKEQAVKETFGLSATRYYQLLGGLIDRPEALEHDPMLVKRLRRLRATRQRDRAARRLGMRP
ncbi:DUF3263 domain-containing protein [Nonomuraea terrae]|jgi:hypothetical protein|uniref:DUF3263 domain-containing protein n=2 Tax=Nonomuraea terrae TaxID=2530383 RepID=A0A4R4YU74_9ACTN|nr:DUF3263 domain-containing protein [Nonomuraea terrae]